MASVFSIQDDDEFFIDFISRTLIELNKHNQCKDTIKSLEELMPGSWLAQGPEGLWYFYLTQDNYVTYTEQKKGEDLTTFINYTIGRLEDDEYLYRPKFKMEDLTDFDQPRLYNQLTIAEKKAYARLKGLMPNSILAVNSNIGVYTLYLDRNTEYTRQLQNESLVEFINRIIGRLYESKRTPDPDIDKDNVQQPTGKCMPVPIPEGHVRVQLYLEDYQQAIWAYLPARVYREDEFCMDDFKDFPSELDTETLGAIEGKCMRCNNIEWQSDERGIYQVANIKL